MDSTRQCIIIYSIIASVHSFNFWATPSNARYFGPVLRRQYHPNYCAISSQATNYGHHQRVYLCMSPYNCKLYNGVNYGQCSSNQFSGTCCQLPSLPTYLKPARVPESVSTIISPAVTELSTVATSNSTSSIETSTKYSKEVVELICGRQRRGYRRRARVVGGQRSLSDTQWPWMAALFQMSSTGYKQKCGAVLISEMYAITAAHCVVHLEPYQLMLLIGSDQVSHEGSFAVKRNISSFKVHERFDKRSLANDIALIRFANPVEFATNIVPVCVPQSPGDLVNLTATLLGWGRISESGPMSQHLLYTNMTIITNQRCAEEFVQGGLMGTVISDEFLCTYQGGRHSQGCL
ncbi:Serine proteinase stubble [Halotydeus destructor]|nr:Serine proteinase stubble [Halotydeus destructor]